MSATLPRHLAIAPDGRSLVVAIHGGGAYNVLPIGTDGRLERVAGILKETGSGPKTKHQDASHPQMVMFDTTGRHLLSTDLGSDRLNVFAFANHKLTPRDRSATQPGSGPRQMALHPAGHLIYVRNELEDSMSCYGYDAANGKITQRLQHVACSGDSNQQAGNGALAIHPSGRFLYTSNLSTSPYGIAVWRIDSSTGGLTPIQSLVTGMDSQHAITMVNDGSSMLVLSQTNDCILQLRIDPATGHLDRPVQVAKVAKPMSLAIG
jgi:6-phosphogluconolactonase (cycloisomerase 2 family)